MTLFRRRDREAELREEIDAHLALAEDEYRRAGMSATDARDAAQRKFGSVLKTRQAHRDERSFRPLDLLLQDIRFAFRVLTRDRGFTLTAILVLGIGIGVNNMMFTIIYSHTLRGLPMRDAGRVLYLSAFDDRAPDFPLSYPELDDVRSARSFSGVAAFISAPMTLADEGRAPDRFDGSYVSADAFEVAVITPLRGRSFTAAEETAAAPVAMLGAGAWRSRYGADNNILGQSVIVNGTPVTVVGIVPARSGFPSTAEVWLPLSRAPNLARDRRDVRTLRVFGRLRDGVSHAAAKAEVEAIIANDARVKAAVIPINQRFLGRPTDPAWLAFITAGFLVFLVSCANVANLLLARAVVRAREFAIRGSLGARRLRIAGQLLIESLVLAALGAAAGIAVSLAGIRVFASYVPENTLPYWLNYSMDGRVLSALVAVSFVAVLVFGVVPALQGSRVDVNRSLKDGGRSATGRRGARRLTTAFLVAEFALTIVLVANVVTSIRTNTPPLPSDARINSRDLVVASVTLPSDRYPSAQQRAAFYAQLDERLAADTSVSAAAIASVPPGPGGTEQQLEVEGQPLGAGDKPPAVWSVAATPGYFDALTVPVIRGRALAADDGQPGRAHSVVNERFVEMFMPGREPIGQRIRISAPVSSAPAEWLTIVGVSQTIRQQSRSSPDPIVYVPFATIAPPNATILVRSSAATTSLTAALRGRVMEVDANVPLYRVRTMKRALEDADWNRRLSAKLITTLTLITLVFSIVGLYAVTAHAVSQRTQEIGIRMALGAGAADVRRLILRRAAFQVALGLAAGLAATAAWDGVFFSGRVELRFLQVDTFVSLAVVLTVVTAIACIVPVRRATRLDPVVALRQD